MSKYDWERGTIVIPAAAWAGFKKALRDGYNKVIVEDYNTAVRLHAAIKEAIKGKRGVDLRKVAFEVASRVKPRSAFASRYEEDKLEFPFVLCEMHHAIYAMVKAEKPTDKPKLLTPKKSSFAPANSSTLAYDAGGEAHIRLDNEKRTVTWSVSENNHACERARETYMGKLLFRTLQGITWTRNSGGALVGNDEYNRESDSAGGGGNYLKDRFGPLGDDEYEHMHGIRPGARSSSRSLGRSSIRGYLR